MTENSNGDDKGGGEKGGGEKGGVEKGGVEKDGKIVAIAGPVVDIEFAPGSLPEINTAVTMKVELEGTEIVITAEVAQHIGESRVRAICMKPTDGLRRGTPVHNTGRGITVPVGPGVLGHVFNVIGEPLDTEGEEVTEGIEDHWDIHRPSPAFADLEPRSEMFETGIKVIDLLAPYAVSYTHLTLPTICSV